MKLGGAEGHPSSSFEPPRDGFAQRLLFEYPELETSLSVLNRQAAEAGRGPDPTSTESLAPHEPTTIVSFPNNRNLPNAPCRASSRGVLEAFENKVLAPLARTIFLQR